MMDDMFTVVRWTIGVPLLLAGAWIITIQLFPLLGTARYQLWKIVRHQDAPSSTVPLVGGMLGAAGL